MKLTTTTTFMTTLFVMRCLVVDERQSCTAEAPRPLRRRQLDIAPHDYEHRNVVYPMTGDDTTADGGEASAATETKGVAYAALNGTTTNETTTACPERVTPLTYVLRRPATTPTTANGGARGARSLRAEEDDIPPVPLNHRRHKRVVYRPIYSERYARSCRGRKNCTQTTQTPRARRHARDDDILPPLVRHKRVVYRPIYSERYARSCGGGRKHCTTTTPPMMTTPRAKRHVARRGEARHRLPTVAFLTPPWSLLERPTPPWSLLERPTPPQCYRFGDCIDENNANGDFYGQRLVRFIRDDAVRMIDDAASYVERRLHIIGRVPMTPLRYESLRLCTPNDSDLIGDVGKRFVRKMYETYVIADAINAAYYETRVLNEDLKGRLTVINATLSGSRRRLRQLPQRATPNDDDASCARRILMPSPPRGAIAAVCGRSDDCIDVETMMGQIVLSNLKCYAASSAVAINALFANIETFLNASYAPSTVPPFEAETVCSPTELDVVSVAYASKVGATYALANGTHLAFYDAFHAYRQLYDRLRFVGRLIEHATGV
jgi:hypothetical protein